MQRLVLWHRWTPPADSDADPTELVNGWRRRVEGRLANESADILAKLGGTIVCSFDPAFAVPVVDACLELLTEHESVHKEGSSIALALTVGDVRRPADSNTIVGEAIDRAQALANRARGGELVLDPEARNHTSTVFLFARQVSPGGGIHGETVDRKHPRRELCRENFAWLGRAPLPPAAQAQFNALRQVAGGTGRHRVTLVGPYGAGASAWIARLAEELDPAVCLDMTGVAGALAPLGSLAYALRRQARIGRSFEKTLDNDDEGDREAAHTLTQIRSGMAVQRGTAVEALRRWFLRLAEAEGGRVWISLNPLPMIDPATVGVVAEATRENGPDHLLFLRVPLDQRTPAVFTRGGGLAEIRLPTLNQRDALAIASGLLGDATSNEVSRRAAVMGGTTPLGVAEAVRTLVASGDLIHDGERFSWRRGPAGRVGTVPIEVLLEERINGLEAVPRRMLEALSCAPDASELTVVHAVAEADGLNEDEREMALDQLVTEGFLDEVRGDRVLAPLVRSVVTQAMPPARRAEQQRFVARSLRVTPDGDGSGFSAATLAYYVAGGGRPQEAVDLLLSSGMQAGQLGYVRAAVRLAAAAVQCDPSDETRQAAARLTQALTERQAQARKRAPVKSPTKQPPSEAGLPLDGPSNAAPAQLKSHAVQQAVGAILGRDFDQVERSLELMVAAGSDGPGVDRLRAMSLLSRGDAAGAMRMLEQAKARNGSGRRRDPRTALALALVLLETGEVGQAVRAGLRALASARKAGDNAGQQASLRALAHCYRHLGREDEARLLESAG